MTDPRSGISFVRDICADVGAMEVEVEVEAGMELLFVWEGVRSFPCTVAVAGEGVGKGTEEGACLMWFLSVGCT